MTSAAVDGRRPRWRTVGWHPGFAAAAVLGVLASFTFGWGWIAPAPLTPTELFNPLSPLLFVVVSFSLLGSSRIVFQSTGVLDLVGPVIIRRIAVSAIASLEHDDALTVRLLDGRSFGNAAFGKSLAGRGPGYPRARRAVERLRYEIAELPPGVVGESRELPPVEVRLRGGAVSAGLGLALLLLAGALVINLATP